MRLTETLRKFPSILAVFTVLLWWDAGYSQSGQESNKSPGGFLDKVYDHYGNAYTLADIRIDSVKTYSDGVKKTTLLNCNPGIFNIFFEANSGMENPGDPEHVSRRAVLCQVLQDVSDFLETALMDPLNSNRVNLWVRNFSDINAPAGTLGMATGFYSFPGGSPVVAGGIVDNEISKTIRSGRDSYEGVATPLLTGSLSTGGAGSYYHGMLAFDFNIVTWHTDLQSSPETGSGVYDLYTVMLHEILHALGLNSLVSANGTSVLNGSGYYSRYDTFLRNSTLTQSLIVQSSGMCSNMYGYVFNPALATSVLSPGCAPGYPTNETSPGTAIHFDGTVTIPLYTPACFEAGSSLSHFEDALFLDPLGAPYGNDAYFALCNGLSAEVVRRSPRPEERQALCDIGYRVGHDFGSGANGNYVCYGTCDASADCNGIEVVGVNDGIESNGTFTYAGVATNSNPIQIGGILGNDVPNSPDMRFECLEDVYDSSTVLSPHFGDSSTVIQMVAGTTPVSAGVHLLRYVPFNNATGQRGNITYVYVYVNQLADCAAPSVCNLVANGSFEEMTADPDNYGQIANACGWISGNNASPDYYTATTTTPNFDVPNNENGCENASEGNAYAGIFVSGGNGENSFSEMVMTKLVAPLELDSDYVLTFDVSLNEAFSNFVLPVQAYLSPVWIASAGTDALMTGDSEQWPGMLFQSTTNVTETNGWQTITFNIHTNQGGLQYLYLGWITSDQEVSPNIPVINPACSVAMSEGSRTAYYIDNVRLTPLLDASSFGLPQVMCENQTLYDLTEYLSDVSPDGTFSGDGVTLEDDVFSLEGILASPGVHTITYTVVNNLGCEIVLADTITVLESDDAQCECQNDLTLDDPDAGLQELYQRHEWILADDGYEISGFQNITMKAGEYIQFNPSTSFTTSIQFTAYIEDCCESCRISAVKELLPTPVKSLQLNPNPTTGELAVQLELDGYSAQRISVISFEGRLILDKEIPKTNSFTLDVSSYAAGMYIMNITADDGNMYSEKFIKN